MAIDVNCGELNEEYIGKKVALRGWCRYIRDHGGKLFIDLADMHGITQLVFEGKVKEEAEELGKEYVIYASGIVRRRGEETVDKTNPTGTIEVYVEEFDIINKSKLPPFEIIDEKRSFLPNEDLRLKYRYLDLRRREMVKKIEFRDKIAKIVRKYMWDQGFLELETPTLVKDTYETGSRTFLVPSRTKKGTFYSLPQSPQIYKQLCMIAGIDKYFQMARCYRDEDPREDRQPEFTQVDLEVSFKDEKYIEGVIEGLIKTVFDALGKKVDIPFKHMKYADAIATYGSDKPDLRFDSKIIDITEIMKSSNYNVVKRVIASGGKVKAMCFDAEFDGKEGLLDENYMLKLVDTAKSLGLRGLTWLYVKESKVMSEPESIAESIGEEACEKIKQAVDAKDGNIIVICSDPSETLLLNAMGKLRKLIGDKIGKYKSEYEFLWIDHFPLFEKDEITGKLKPSHNPFTAPTPETQDLIEKEPEKVLSRQYDLVLNGVEIGGGSIRINDAELQRKVLRAIGMSDEEIDNSFGFLIEALQYGAPIEGGIALGFDRFVALLYGEQDIKEFILFPKNKKYESPIDGSPTQIDPKRLRDDLGIGVEV
ncbi:MAG: aspartate--tRNA ligase [Candidatus Micrarchaeota archaeon]